MNVMLNAVVLPMMIGTSELLLIGALVLLLFGGKKLPEMMRGLGQGVREFKKGVNEIKEDAKDEVSNDEPSDNHSPNDDNSKTSDIKQGDANVQRK